MNNGLTGSTLVSGVASVSTATLPFLFESWPTHTQVRLLRGLSAAPWPEVEKVGNEVVGEVDRQEAPRCLIDLTALDNMRSADVALIVRIWKAVKNRNGKVAVVCNNDLVLKVISLAGLDKVWTIVETREEGLEHLGVKAMSGSALPVMLAILALLGSLTSLAGCGLHVMEQTEASLIHGLIYGGAGSAVLLGLLAAIFTRGGCRWTGIISILLGGLSAAAFELKWLEKLPF